jgi:enoyl-CoA hydratase/carnithine racemase
VIEIEPSHEGRVEHWWLNRREARNALSLAMWAQLRDEAERVRRDRTIRVVVIRGRGGHFSAGADIAQLGRALAADHDGSNYRETNAAAEEALATLPAVTIAAVEGYCVGGGVQVAAACDLRLATSSASFAVTPAKLGIAYPARAVARLAAAVGPTAASEMLLTADMFDATYALRVGLITRIEDELDGAVDRLIAALLARSSFTQIATKSIINHVTAANEIDDAGRQWEQDSLGSDDLREGLAAFAEKRAAVFGDRWR